MSKEPPYPPGLEWLIQSASNPASIRQRLATYGQAQLVAVILQLLSWIATLLGEDKDLRARLAQNSGNSSRPPSSDGYQKPAPKSTREKSGRKPGGQPDHPGVTLKKVDKPDHYEMCPRPKECPCCGNKKLDRAKVVDVETRQVFDLPEPRPLEVTEHISETVECTCGYHIKAPFPQHVTQPTQYGPRLQSTVTYLNEHQVVPYERTQQAMQDLFGVHLSQGTIYNILRRAHQKLQEFQWRMVVLLIMARVVHFDESGIRVLKELYWLHVASTARHTLFHVDEHRGELAMIAMGILPHFKGKAVHDHWASYFKYEGCFHALCNSHHLRELVYAHEQYQQSWAHELILCLLEANAEVIAAKAKGLSSLPPDRLEYFSERYSRILRNGREELKSLPAPTKASASELEPGEEAPKKRGRKKQHKVKNLYDRLHKHKKGTLEFMYDFDVPFTNNQSERDIRMSKVKQKVSGCFRSLLGAEMYARIRSYVSTAKKQGFGAMGALMALFTGDDDFIRRLTERH
jgi:transposase